MKLVFLLRNLDDQSVQEVVIDRVPVLFGRSKICDIPLSDPILSRQHCSLELTADGKAKIQDLDSANGSFFEGQKFKEKILIEGQSFQIGRTGIEIVKIDAVSADEEKTVEEILLDREITASRSKSAATQMQPAPAKPVKAVPPPKKVEPATTEEKSALSTPAVLRSKASKSTYKTKDWVQVSIFWKNELTDIRCFDIGSIVTLGENASNDFVVSIPSLPATFKLIKILPNGVELQLHPAMKGMIETRGSVKQLDDLRLNARQTDLGLSTFVQFSDKCLIEMGPFSIFIQSVRLNLTAPLTPPLIKEPLYTTVLLFVLAVFIPFAFFVHQKAADAEEAKVEEPEVLVKVEAPDAAKEPPPPPPAPPPAPKTPVKKVEAPKPQQKAQMSGREGAGAKAKGDEGKAGRTTGRVPVKARPLGIVTDVAKPVRAAPKGAFGKEVDPNRARRGLRPDQGVGSGKPKPAGTGGQAPSKQIADDVNVQDLGVMGALGAKGGGGKAAAGGELGGAGLGGELTGSLEGQERGADLDARGAGGRGAKGIGLGGGGTAIDVSGGLGTKGKGGGKEGFGLGSSGKKGEASVSYSGEDIEVVDGLTREEVERVVRANQAQINACYDRALLNAGGKDLRGRIRVKWFVNREGRVENVQRATGAELGDFLFNCMSQAMSGWQFPKPRGGSGAGVSWGWTFQKGL